MRPKNFYERAKVRLVDLRAVRAEMCAAYRACVRKELAWEDYRSASLGLSRLAAVDEGSILEQRVAELEKQLASAKQNGHGNGDASLHGRPAMHPHNGNGR